MDARTNRPRTEGALGGGDDLTRPLLTDELRDKGIVRADHSPHESHAMMPARTVGP